MPQNPPASRYQAIASSTAAAVEDAIAWSFHWQLRKCVVSVYFTAKRSARQHRNYKKIALDTARTAWYNKLLYVAMDSRIQPLLLSLVYQPLCEKSTRMVMF